MKITPKDSETICDNIYLRSGSLEAKLEPRIYVPVI